MLGGRRDRAVRIDDGRGAEPDRSEHIGGARAPARRPTAHGGSRQRISVAAPRASLGCLPGSRQVVGGARPGVPRRAAPGYGHHAHSSRGAKRAGRGRHARARLASGNFSRTPAVLVDSNGATLRSARARLDIVEPTRGAAPLTDGVRGGPSPPVGSRPFATFGLHSRAITRRTFCRASVTSVAVGPGSEKRYSDAFGLGAAMSGRATGPIRFATKAGGATAFISRGPTRRSAALRSRMAPRSASSPNCFPNAARWPRCSSGWASRVPAHTVARSTSSSKNAAFPTHWGLLP